MTQKLKVLRELEEDEKIAPQMQAIYNTIVDAVGVNEWIERPALVEKLTENGSLNTRQDPSRVVGFYLPRFRDKGILEVEKTAPAAKGGGESGDSKPGKAEAAAE